MIRESGAIIALLFLTDICFATSVPSPVLPLIVTPPTRAPSTVTPSFLWNPTEVLRPEIFLQRAQATNDPLDILVPTEDPDSFEIEYIPSPTKSAQYNPVATEASNLVGVEYSPSTTKSPQYNSVATKPADPVGIEQVSGLYGPGAWSGWVLTIVGAWWQIMLPVSEAKISLNTWSFLVGMNWAAADLLRCIRLVNEASKNSDKLFQLGSYAAAFNVTFWGLFHVVLQIASTLLFTSNLKRVRRRLWTLLASIILPLVALSAASFQLSPELINSLPALYWHEMDHQIHKDLFRFTANSFIFLLPGFLIFAYLKGDKYLSCPVIAKFRSVVSEAWNTLSGLASGNSFTKSIFYYVFVRIPVFISSLFIGMVIYAFADNILWFVALGLPLYIFHVWAFAIVGPLLWLIWILNSSLKYILEGYAHRNLWISKSCFFMPCAPQPLTDEDQLYPLVVGLASLLIFDIGPTVYKKCKPTRHITAGSSTESTQARASYRMRHLPIGYISAPQTAENALGWN